MGQKLIRDLCLCVFVWSFHKIVIVVDVITPIALRTSRFSDVKNLRKFNVAFFGVRAIALNSATFRTLRVLASRLNPAPFTAYLFYS